MVLAGSLTARRGPANGVPGTLAEPRCCGAGYIMGLLEQVQPAQRVYHYIRAQSRGSWPAETPPPLAELSSAEVITVSHGWAEARAAGGGERFGGAQPHHLRRRGGG